MDISKASEVLWNLNPGERREIYRGRNGTIIFVIRTDKFCLHDFAVGLKIPGKKEFRPTHIRLLFDLYLKRTSDEEDAKKLFLLLEKVFNGEDPERLAPEALQLTFPMQLDDPDVNLYYAQLLMIEQDFNYGPKGRKKSNFDPPRTFLMGFIRWVASGEIDIDKIIFRAIKNKPPPHKYVRPKFSLKEFIKMSRTLQEP